MFGFNNLKMDLSYPQRSIANLPHLEVNVKEIIGHSLVLPYISRPIQSINNGFASGRFINLRDSNFKPVFDKYPKVIEIDYAILVKI
jgi:hypothetical protein